MSLCMHLLFWSNVSRGYRPRSSADHADNKTRESLPKGCFLKTRESLPKGCFLKMIIDLGHIKIVFSEETVVDIGKLNFSGIA